MTGKIMVIAGEISGDERAAEVVQKIQELNPHVNFFGMGTTKLKEQGVEVVIDPTELESVGIWEVIKNYQIHKEHYKVMKDIAKKRDPDVLFLVDYSGFNMFMTRLGHKMDIPVVNYFPPSAWLWGEWRAKFLARYNPVVAANFPMDRDVYRRNKAETKFVGHPLLDEINVEAEKDELKNTFELKENEIPIALLPGSRKAELEKLLPIMLKTAVKLREDNKDYVFIIPSADPKFNDFIEKNVIDYPLKVKIVNNHTHKLLKMSHFAIVSTGTATLEAMILNTPMVIIYKFSDVTYKMFKYLSNQEFFSMPNIIAEKKIVPELMQEEVTPEKIYEEAHYILSKPYLMTDIKIKLVSAAEKLGSQGAIDKTARLVMREGNIDVLKK
ncbi:MAG TPA: lipid-A-disaccharide synthase [Halanaerobiales bacterium]|nr:lipid-A-disaccharide synthase [Halanaerobiales bacterium]